MFKVMACEIYKSRQEIDSTAEVTWPVNFNFHVESSVFLKVKINNKGSILGLLEGYCELGTTIGLQFWVKSSSKLRDIFCWHVDTLEPVSRNTSAIWYSFLKRSLTSSMNRLNDWNTWMTSMLDSLNEISLRTPSPWTSCENPYLSKTR